MRTQKIKFIVTLTTIILGFILPSYLGLTMAYPNIETPSNQSPTLQDDIVYYNSTPPVIDGNLESYEGEWENATILTAEFSSKPVTIRVQANDTHLFMAFTYTSKWYFPINTTIPVGDTYNNESHTWFTVVFDRNYDRLVGNEDYADDAIAINYRMEGAQDAFITGRNNDSFVMDVNVTGIENTYAAVNVTLDDFNNNVVTVELFKELNSDDVAGNDIDALPNDYLVFAIIVLENRTALYNYDWLFGAITAWKTIKLESQHTYFSYVADSEELEELEVIIYTSETANTEANKFTSFYNLINFYGMNITSFGQSDDYEIRTDRIEGTDLFILIGGLTFLESSEIEVIRSFVASGGSLLVIADASVAGSKMNNLISHFGIEFFTSTVFSKDLGINSSLVVETTDILDLPYMTDTTSFTYHTVTAGLDYFGTAINFTGDIGESVYQFQEGDLYSIFNKSGDYFIDSDNDGEFNATNDISLNDSVTLQAALELQRGGKVLAYASADMFNNSYIGSRSMQSLVLRQLQWLLNFQHLISFDNYNVVEESVIVGDEIHVNIEVTGDNDTALEGVSVWAVYQELKADQNSSMLTDMGDKINFNGSFVPEGISAKFIDVSIRMHLRGYGYNETGLFQVFVEPILSSSISLDVIALITFIISLGLAGLGVFSLRKNRPKKE